MTSLRDSVVLETLSEVRIIYLDRATTKWWNARRGPDDVAAFTGFFWIRGKLEGGPFKTRSAAIANAYYRFVRNEQPPTYSSGVDVRKRGEAREPRRAFGADADIETVADVR